MFSEHPAIGFDDGAVVAGSYVKCAIAGIGCIRSGAAVAVSDAILP